MKLRLGMLVPLALVVGLLAPSTPTSAETALAGPGWKGRAHVQAGAYSWVGPSRPSGSYTLAVVRGKDQRAALRALGVVRRKLGAMTPARAADEAFVFDESGIRVSSIVQVERRGGAVVVYQPYGSRPSSRLRQLSSEGLVSLFSTQSANASHVKVARDGELIRAFRPHRKPPRHGALPQEKGLDFGARDGNVFATSWAFVERVSLIHLSEQWFSSRHPTFLLKGGGLG